MSRYASAHAKTNGPGDARPTALQIIKDEGLENRLSDKVMVITGCSSGIGIETARALHATGATIFATVRNVDKGQIVINEILASDPSNKSPIHLIPMELDSFVSIKAGAKAILGKTDRINIVINNAGVMSTPEGQTKDGFETQFGTNHLGHFLLFQLLKDTLLKSSTPDFPSRVVSVSSLGHRASGVRFDDFNFEKGAYDPWESYGQAKTANIYMSNEIERRYGSKGLHSTSLHPGSIITGLQVHMDPEIMKMTEIPEVMRYMKSPEQGAATSVSAAVSEEWKNKGGKYLSDCVVQNPVRPGSTSLTVGDDGYAAWAYDEEKEGKLWKESLKMVGMEDDQ
jgi:NAD(P)-dependent dehydrogenase (short-subunit alcohol dehydrogenase family)